MTRVLGLDLSLTATGVAQLYSDEHGTEPPVTSSICTKPTGPLITERRDRIHYITDTIAHLADGAQLVVVEGPSLGSRDGHIWDRAGLWWTVAHRLTHAGIPIVEIPPTVLKKFATGKGNAVKTAVAAAITRLWPTVEPRNDNEFDALALATMGAQHLGIDVPTRAHHADTLTKITWPEGAAP
jgi:Holliday junction resolvasome RuvABC endonuclease subunit